MSLYQARTFYGVPIVGASCMVSRADALQWAADNVRLFPGSAVFQQTKRGWRAIWRDKPEALERAA